MSASGKYRQQFVVLTETTSDDGEGGQEVDWVPGTVIWGEKRPYTSREQALAGALQNVVTYQVYTHFLAGLTSKNRLRQSYPEGPDLQIVSVRDPDQRSKHLELECTESIDANA